MQKSKVNKNNLIYLDYASSTPIDNDVLKVMINSLKIDYANPNGIHNLSLNSKNKLQEAKNIIANILKSKKEEIIFTSGATEANNLAILGMINKNNKNKPHFITTNIEHSSVLETMKYLKKEKIADISFVKVEQNGIVSPKKIKEALRKNTVLVSIIYANNEIGTIQPIKEIAKEIRFFNKFNKRSVLFHTDATQAINYLPINVQNLGIDLMSFNAHKIYGPKGVGVLFKKKNIFLHKILFGGIQEFDLRPGTESLPLILGITKALEIVEKIKKVETKRLFKLQNYFVKKLINIIPDLIINGDLEKRLPNNINITIPKIPSDLLVVELSNRNIFISEKSACKSFEKKGSYVIKAIQNTDENIPSLRFSLGRDTIKKDIDFTISNLSNILKKINLWYK